MIRPWISSLARWLVIACLFVGLTSCNRLQTEIPQNVVAAAVTLQAQREQQALWQQLSPDAAAAPQLSVKKVKLQRVRQVKVAADLAYEVFGTYQYKLRYPNRPTVNQSQVPFGLILRGDAETNDWQLLQRGTATTGDRAWQWQPLESDPA